MKYLRFGKIPTDERSVNFLKVQNSKLNIYQHCGFPDEVKENGVSVFNITANGMPELKNMRLVFDLASRLDCADVYEVEGEQISTGNDGEPLICNIKVIRKVQIDQAQLINYITSSLKAHFKKIVVEKSCDISPTIFQFWHYEKQNNRTGEVVVDWYSDDSDDTYTALAPYSEFCFAGYSFSNAVEGFDTSTGLK